MRLPTSAEIGRLKRLLDGEQLPSSQLNTSFFEDLLKEGFLMVVPKGKNRSVVVAKNKEYLAKHISQQWQIKDLDEYVSFREGPSPTRIEVQNVLGDIKGDERLCYLCAAVSDAQTAVVVAFLQGIGSYLVYVVVDVFYGGHS